MTTIPRFRPLLWLAALLLVAACSGDRDEGISNPVTTRFTTDSASAPQIEVTVTDRQAVETAELVAPDGAVTGAYKIDRDRIVEGGGPSPSVGVGVYGGSSGDVGTSIGIGIPIFGDYDTGDPEIDSRAVIRVPDMEAYRAGWQHYRVRLRLGPPENQRVMEIPAPRPPEG